MEFILFGIAILLLILSFLVRYKLHILSLAILSIGMIVYLYHITKYINTNDFSAISDVYPTTNTYVTILIIVFIPLFIIKILLENKKRIK